MTVDAASAGARAAGAAPAGPVLVVAVLGVAHGSLFVRLADLPALAVTAWRLTLATLIVFVARLAWRAYAVRRDGGVPAPSAAESPADPAARRRARLQATVCGVLLALHFAGWISSLSYTTVVQSVMLADTTPVWVLLFGWAVLGRRPAARQWWALMLAFAGAAVLTLPIFRGVVETPAAAANTLLGNSLAIGSAVVLGAYLLIAEAAQRTLRFGEFVQHVYGVAAGVAWLLAIGTGTVATWQVADYGPQAWWALLGIAAVSQCLGHGGFNYAVRHLAPAVVSLAVLGEPVIAGILAWVFLGEVPGPLLYVGGALVLAGVALAVWPSRTPVANLPAE